MNAASAYNILEFLIVQKEKSHHFYKLIGSISKADDRKEAIEQMSHEEWKQKKQLQSIKETSSLSLPENLIINFPPSYFSLQFPVDTKVSLKKALQIAMNNEKAFFRFYNEMSEYAKGLLKPVFHSFAIEASRRKLKIEIWLDEL